MSVSPKRRRRQSSVEGTLDTAFGWAVGDQKTLLVRGIMCAILLFVFAGPILTIIVGAFDFNTDPM